MMDKSEKDSTEERHLQMKFKDLEKNLKDLMMEHQKLRSDKTKKPSRIPFASEDRSFPPSSIRRNDSGNGSANSNPLNSQITKMPGLNVYQAKIEETSSDDQSMGNIKHEDQILGVGLKQDITALVCNCKKSKCLKLYCDCFAEGVYCNADCNCNDCFNQEEHEDERKKMISTLLDRNPEAFKPKLESHKTVYFSIYLRKLNIPKAVIAKDQDV